MPKTENLYRFPKRERLYKFVDSYFAFEKANYERAMAWVALEMKISDKPIVVSHGGKKYVLSVNSDLGPRMQEVVDHTRE